MVIKGSARAAPGELAYHLLREDTNEAVRVLGFSGVASLDLREALAELDGMGAGSRSSRTLYHASINTPVSEQLTDEQQHIARLRLALKLGLAEQPFAVVEHVKHGRQHIHIVWSRVDIDTGKAIPDSHNYRKHEEVARELELEFGHERVLGAHVRDKENEPRPGRGPTWGEQRQAERSGLTPQAAKQVVTECWRQTRTGTEFMERLEAEGFIVARGDRRDFVLIDAAGEVHGLTRRIEGMKAAEVRSRMADLDIETLPDVAEARRLLRQRQPEQEITHTPTSALERLQAKEKGEAEAANGSRAPLRNSDQEAAEALWQLGKTMRGQVDATIAADRGQAVQAPEPTPPPAIDFRPVSQKSKDTQPVVIPPEIVPPPEPVKRPLLQRIAGWIMGRSKEQANPESQNPADGMVAGVSPEALQRSSVVAVNQPETQNRPSFSLFVQIFGYLIEAYQQALDRAKADELKQQGASGLPEPAREDLFDRAMKRRETRTDEQKEAARAAALLRDQENRLRDQGRVLKPEE